MFCRVCCCQCFMQADNSCREYDWIFGVFMSETVSHVHGFNRLFGYSYKHTEAWQCEALGNPLQFGSVLCIDRRDSNALLHHRGNGCRHDDKDSSISPGRTVDCSILLLMSSRLRIRDQASGSKSEMILGLGRTFRRNVFVRRGV